MGIKRQGIPQLKRDHITKGRQIKAVLQSIRGGHNNSVRILLTTGDWEWKVKGCFEGGSLYSFSINTYALRLCTLRLYLCIGPCRK